MKETSREREPGDDKARRNSVVDWSSDSDEEDDKQWDFGFLDSEAEDGAADDGKRLTLLVRKSYLGYMHKVLSENFSTWFIKTGNKEANKLTDTELAKYSMLLERKALRGALMATMYQRSMVQVMREVKKSTQQCKLYEDLLRKTNFFRSKYCDRGIQTESRSRRGSSLRSKRKPLFTQGSASSGGGNTVAMVSPLRRNHVLGPPSQESGGGGGGRRLKGSTTLEGKKLCKAREESPLPSKPRISLEERLSSLFGEANATSSNNNCPDEVIIGDSDDDDEREGGDGFSARSRPLVIDWHKESVAQVSNLNRALGRLSPRQRAFLEKRFKDLFGASDSDDASPTSNVTLCKRRIADIVVNELTQFYLSCRIGSKYLFKQLARHITDSILMDSYAPDPKDVIKRVNEMFKSGRSVMTADDLSLITS